MSLHFTLLLPAQNPIVMVIAHRSGRLFGAFDGEPTIHRVGCVHSLVTDTKCPTGQGQCRHVEVGICNDRMGSNDIEYLGHRCTVKPVLSNMQGREILCQN